MKENLLQTINIWTASPFTQDTENLASKSHETRRIPDPYVFVIREGKLQTPTGSLVENAVLRGNKIYDAEYDALMKIQKWAGRNDEGVSLWFSPPFENGYSALKIVASEILYSLSGEKVLFNRAIVIDANESQSVQIASQFPGEKQYDPEILRKEPIFVNSSFDWLGILSEYTLQTNQMMDGADIKIKNITLREVNKIIKSTGLIFADNIAKEKGLIGPMLDSCDAGQKSSFNAFFENALGEFPCPRCHGPIPSGIGMTRCPHCGLTKEQAGSTCG